MSRVVFAFALLLIFGVIKLPAERALALQHRQVSVSEIADLDLRERIGQLGFVARSAAFARSWPGNARNGDAFCFCSDK